MPLRPTAGMRTARYTKTPNAPAALGMDGDGRPEDDLDDLLPRNKARAALRAATAPKRTPANPKRRRAVAQHSDDDDDDDDDHEEAARPAASKGDEPRPEAFAELPEGKLASAWWQTAQELVARHPNLVKGVGATLAAIALVSLGASLAGGRPPPARQQPLLMQQAPPPLIQQAPPPLMQPQAQAQPRAVDEWWHPSPPRPPPPPAPPPPPPTPLPPPPPSPSPLSPPLPRPPPASPPPPPPEVVNRLNERFRTDPFGRWPEGGELLDAGVLVHCWDGYENHNEPWIPRENMPDLSASLVFQAQQAASTPIPIYRACRAGVVFKPGETKLRCGNGGDSGGHCHIPNKYNKYEHWCELEPRPARFDAPGDGCVGNSWRPRDIGAFLLRVSEYQARSGRSSYNEFIVDGDHWARQMPQTVEFIFQVKGQPTHGSLADAAKHHAAFLRRYGISPSDSPLLEIDPDDWEAPFRVAEGFSAESVAAIAGPGRFPGAHIHTETHSPAAISDSNAAGWDDGSTSVLVGWDG